MDAIRSPTAPLNSPFLWPFLPSHTEECARAAGDRRILASRRRSWWRRRSATESGGHNSPDWRNSVGLQDLVRLVAHPIPSSVSDCVRSVHARYGIGGHANRHPSDRVCAPRRLAVYRHDIRIPEDWYPRAPHAQPLSDLALGDIGIRSIFGKIGGVHLVLNHILEFDVESRCRHLCAGPSAIYRCEQNRKNRGFLNHAQD